jgi:hypothetical protein
MKLLPGKPIFNRFCGAFFGVETTRVREAYTDVAVKGKPTVFKDIEQIMLSFAGVTGTNPL